LSPAPWRALKTVAVSGPGPADNAAANGGDRKAQKRSEAQARQKRADARKPFLALQVKLDAEMKTLSDERKAVEAWLASPEAYAEDVREPMKAALERQREIQWQLARAETAWLKLQEQIDELPA